MLAHFVSLQILPPSPAQHFHLACRAVPLPFGLIASLRIASHLSQKEGEEGAASAREEEEGDAGARSSCEGVEQNGMRRQLSRAGRADPLHYSGLLCGAGSALLASLIATPPVLCVSASRVRPRQNQHDIAIAEGRAHYAEVGLPRARDDRDTDGKARASERRRRRRHTPFVRVPLVWPSP